MGFEVLRQIDVMVLNKTINVCCSFLYVGASRRGEGEGVFSHCVAIILELSIYYIVDILNSASKNTDTADMYSTVVPSPAARRTVKVHNLV